MGRIDPGATIDRDCRGTSPIESMATSTLATRSPVLNRWLTRPLFKLTIFFLTAAPMTMGAEWEVEYFGTVAEPLRIHWTYQRLPNDGSRYIGLFNDSVCESLTPMILSDDDPSRGIGRLVITMSDYICATRSLTSALDIFFLYVAVRRRDSVVSLSH